MSNTWRLLFIYWFGVLLIEIPHLLRLIERQRVRHDLPRALLLPVAADGPAGAGRGRAHRGRRRGAPDARRLAAHLVDADREPPVSRRRRSAAVLDAEAAAGLHTVEGHAGFAARGLRRSSSDLLGFLIGARARARGWSATARPGKGNTLLNHCGIRSDLLDVHRRPQPVQAGEVPARARTSRSTRPSASPRPARLRARSCRGTCARRSARSCEYVREWGGTLRRRPSPSSKSSEPEVVNAMKVVLFCGGLGMRMRDGSNQRCPSR